MFSPRKSRIKPVNPVMFYEENIWNSKKEKSLNPLPKDEIKTEGQRNSVIIFKYSRLFNSPQPCVS